MRSATDRLFVAALVLLTAAYAVAEEITLTTFYPSPRGVYRELRVLGDGPSPPAPPDRVSASWIAQGQIATNDAESGITLNSLDDGDTRFEAGERGWWITARGNTWPGTEPNDLMFWRWDGDATPWLNSLTLDGATGNVAIGGSESPYQDIGTDRRYLTIIGSPNGATGGAGVLELATQQTPAADGLELGLIQFTDQLSSAADKRSAIIVGAQEGVTAGNMGGRLELFTKADNGTVAERMRVASTGRVGIGSTDPTAQLQVERDVPAFATTGAFIAHGNDPVQSATDVNIYRTRGTTALPTPLVNGDWIGNLNFGGQAPNGTMVSSAKINAAVDGAPVANLPPGRLTFSTRVAGGALMTERMRITSTGNVGIGTVTPQAAAAPNTVATGNLDVNDVWLRGAGAGRWASQAPPPAMPVGNMPGGHDSLTIWGWGARSIGSMDWVKCSFENGGGFGPTFAGQNSGPAGESWGCHYRRYSQSQTDHHGTVTTQQRWAIFVKCPSQWKVMSGGALYYNGTVTDFRPDGSFGDYPNTYGGFQTIPLDGGSLEGGTIAADVRDEGWVVTARNSPGFDAIVGWALCGN